MAATYSTSIESVEPLVEQSGLNTNKPVDFSGAATVALPAGTTIGGSPVVALSTITSSSANALTVGPNGATNPSFNVDASTASAATGINIKSATATAGVAVSVLSSGTDENLTLNAKGAGTITINGIATGGIVLGQNTTLSKGLIATPQNLSGAGAINLTTTFTSVTSTGANALTLANGTVGQIKIITLIVDGGDATLTPTTPLGYSTIVFNDIGDSATLIYTSAGWAVTGFSGVVIS